MIIFMSGNLKDYVKKYIRPLAINVTTTNNAIVTNIPTNSSEFLFINDIDFFIVIVLSVKERVTILHPILVLMLVINKHNSTLCTRC